MRDDTYLRICKNCYYFTKDDSLNQGLCNVEECEIVVLVHEICDCFKHRETIGEK
jgi:hypothetical protein